MAATSSAWVWDSKFSLYYNPQSGQHASYQSDGSWIYSDPSTPSIPNPRRAVNYSEVDTSPDLPLDQVWPANSPPRKSKSTASPFLRLVVLGSSAISPPLSVVVLSTGTTSLGRDKSLDPFEPRIRLKELAVSKNHAYIFFNWDERSWQVVDSGSMHGTFLRGAQKERGVEEREKRLSTSKVASKPFSLEHGEQVLPVFQLWISSVITED